MKNIYLKRNTIEYFLLFVGVFHNGKTIYIYNS